MASFDNKIDFHFQFLYIHYLRTSHPIPNGISDSKNNG